MHTVGSAFDIRALPLVKSRGLKPKPKAVDIEPWAGSQREGGRGARGWSGEGSALGRLGAQGGQGNEAGGPASLRLRVEEALRLLLQLRVE